MDKSLSIGSLASIITIIYIYILHQTNPALLVQGYELWTYAMIVGAMVASVVLVRQAQEHGFADLKLLLQTSFKTFLVVYLLKQFFIFALFKWIDPASVGLIKDASIKIFIQHREPTLAEEVFQQQLAEYSKQDFSPQFDMLGYAIFIVLGFLVSLLIAYIFKREKPDFM